MVIKSITSIFRNRGVVSEDFDKKKEIYFVSTLGQEVQAIQNGRKYYPPVMGVYGESDSMEVKLVVPREGFLKNFKIITNDNTLNGAVTVNLEKNIGDGGEETLHTMTIPNAGGAPGEAYQLVEDSQTEVFVPENAELYWEIDTTAANAGEVEHIMLSFVLEVGKPY